MCYKPEDSSSTWSMAMGVLLQLAGLEPQTGHGRLVVEFRVRRLKFRLRLIQLGLAELDDRTQAEFVAGLGEIERQLGIFQ